MIRTTMTRLLVASLTICALPALPAQAGAISRSVTFATLVPNDTDFFSQGEVQAGNVIFGITTPLANQPNDFNSPNTQLATFVEGNLGTQLTFNDDSLAHYEPGQALNEGALSSLFRLQAESTNNYIVGVTGFDDQFSGSGHNEEGNYLLTTGHVDPSSTGGDFNDTDADNDFFTGADLITLEGNLVAKVAVNTLDDKNDGGDVDFFRVDLQQGDVFTAMTAPLRGLDRNFDSPDTLLFIARVDSGDVIELFHDDDSGSATSDSPSEGESWGSALHFYAPETGTYYLIVSGYNEFESWKKKHGEKGKYALLVSNRRIPEPGTISLLMLGLLPLVRGRLGVRLV